MHPIEEVVFPQRDQGSPTQGQILGQSINLTRHLVNLPPNYLYPESFAKHCEQVALESGLQIEVWDAARLTQEKCHALLAVGQASAREPRLVIMQYRGNPNSSETWGWVGKGVTFDSGGLSIKPSESMLDMKCDMAGAATVLGALQAVAQMKLKVNIIAVMGLVENMLGGNNFRLGDVITARNGTTIEIHNTDAEGRLVLADCLDVAISKGANHLIDLATLTGACMVALGRFVVGGMTNHPAWYARVVRAADECGEHLWQLPMFTEYRDHIRSQVADIKNMGDGRWGGAITAAKFLQEFVQDLPWVHLDIAGPSFQDKASAWVDAGASGVMVRTLVRLAEDAQAS
jgi:leucyl aminopeptidase